MRLVPSLICLNAAHNPTCSTETIRHEAPLRRTFVISDLVRECVVFNEAVRSPWLTTGVRKRPAI